MFLKLLGFLVFIYAFAKSLLLLALDCDFVLAFCDRFGKQIDSLKGKVVAITGASSGIGEALAVQLAAKGVKLALIARRQSELSRVKSECLSFGKLVYNDILTIPFDITNIDKHTVLFDQILKFFGTVDILVNNAGRSQRANWEDINIHVDREMFALNVFAVINLSRIATRYFNVKGEGHIAVVSSLAGLIGVPYSASYTGSKHAIQGYFNGLRTEKIGTKLAVTTFCPGPVFSNFLPESFTDTPGVKYGGQVHGPGRRMETLRCAHLLAIALANRLDECWVALFPVLPMTYVCVYYPRIYKVFTMLVGPQFFQKLRDGHETIGQQQHSVSQV